jgi:hypothetical protein
VLPTLFLIVYNAIIRVSVEKFNTAPIIDTASQKSAECHFERSEKSLLPRKRDFSMQNRRPEMTTGACQATFEKPWIIDAI